MPSPTPSPEATESTAPDETTPAIASRAGDFLSVDLELLDPNPYQPRLEIDPAELEGLAASIAHSGLLQAILIRAKGPGRYEIVAGHRRVGAFRLLLARATTPAERRAYKLIRATVSLATTDAEMATTAYVENAQRVQLTAFEEAAALAAIKELGHHPTAASVAAAIGQPERRVRRLLRLFAAPQVVKDCVSRGLLVEVTPERPAADAEGPGAAQKLRARRRLDLIAALEFARLHQHHLDSNPKPDETPAAAAARLKRADERTTAVMTRALTGNWGLRRIQHYVDGVLKPRPASPQPITAPLPPAPATAAPLERGADESGEASRPASASSEPIRENPVSSTSEYFKLYLGRLKAASREQLESARATLDDARQLLEAQLELRCATGDPEEA